MSLTHIKILKLQLPEKGVKKISDGAGLTLLLKPTGKYWISRYYFRKQRHEFHIGTFPEISLEQAREENLKIRKMARENKDPKQIKQWKKMYEDYQKTRPDFNIIWDEFKEKYKKGKSFTTYNKVFSSMNNHALPAIGHMPIDEIKPSDITKITQKFIDKGSVESAHRILRTIKNVFDHALVQEIVDRNICQSLHKTLPSIKKQHFAAITEPKQFGALLRQIEGYDGSIYSQSGLKLMPLLFVRHLELRSMRWQDIDFDNNEWRFVVTKTDTEHIVPLAKQSIEILKDLFRHSGDKTFVFHNDVSTTKYMSDNTLLSALRRMNIPKEEMTIHGFRASARTLLHEELNIDPNIIEHQLAHDVPDVLGKAYNRTKFLPQRKEMMQRWADYLDDLKNIR